MMQLLEQNLVEAARVLIISNVLVMVAALLWTELVMERWTVRILFVFV